MIALLHNIRSLHNVGSMFRTADAAGIEKLYLCGITSAPVDRFGAARPQIVKVALGAEQYIPWEKCGTTARSRSILTLIDRLKGDGFCIAAIECGNGGISYIDFRPPKRYNKKVAFIMGNEVHGLPKSILTRSDAIIEIPMFGKKESLNVSVAFGIVAFQLRRVL